MPEMSPTGRYTSVAVTLHWLVAVGIIYNLWQGLGFDALEAAHPDNLRAAVNLHKSIGITVLGLVALRVLWKIGHPGPAPLATLQPWERKLSVGVHHLLYLLMVVVPLAGWLHDSAWKAAASHPLALYGVIPWFRLPLFGGLSDAGKDFWHDNLFLVHKWTSFVLIGALALHIAGALKHQFLDRQPQFRRMWFGQ
jgi:cytochrome b561